MLEDTRTYSNTLKDGAQASPPKNDYLVSDDRATPPNFIIWKNCSEHHHEAPRGEYQSVLRKETSKMKQMRTSVSRALADLIIKKQLCHKTNAKDKPGNSIR